MSSQQESVLTARLTTSCTPRRAVFVRKWSGFVSAIWLTAFSGCYVFPNYSTALKEVLGINQKLLNGLAIAEDVGDSIGGIFAGILSNLLPVWTLFCISALVAFLGFGIEWLVVSQTIEPLPYYVMLLAATTAGSTFCWMNVALFNTAVRSFMRNRGPVAGLFKAHMGLSSAVYVAFCSTLFSNSASAYLLMLLTIPSTFSLISAIFFKPVPAAKTEEEELAEETSLHIFNIMACSLAVYIAVITFLPTYFKKGSVYKVVEMVLLFAILGAPALVPLVLFSKVKEADNLEENHNEAVKSLEEVEEDATDDDDEKIFHSQHEHNHQTLLDKAVSNGSETSAPYQPLLGTGANASSAVCSLKEKLLSMVADVSCHCRFFTWAFWNFEEIGEDKSTLSLLKSWHFYLLYFSLFCGCGSAVAFSSNLGQIGQSLGCSSTNLFASLFSLGNFFGRLASGNISEYFLRTMGMQRPAWMGITKIPMILLFSYLSAGTKASLFVGSPVLGFCHGSLVTLSVPIIGEFYGLQHFSTNFTLTNTYFLSGGLVFSSLAGYLYDRKAKAEGKGVILTCCGSKCYGITFRIFAVCLTIGLVCDVVLTLISRRVYQRLQASHANLEKKSKSDSCT